MSPLSEAELAAFRRDGFLVIPGVLDAETVERTRRACLAHRAHARRRVGAGFVELDLRRSFPELAWLITHPPALAVARQLVGPDVLHLRADAVHFGTVNRGWHKDARDYARPGSSPADWSPDYRLVHFAYYFQEHVTHAGAISFKRGSHRIRDDRGGEIVVPPIHAGDLVAFDLRTTHFGNTIQLRPELGWLAPAIYLDRIWRSRRWKALDPARVVRTVVRSLPRVFLPDYGDDRFAAFFVYGADDAHSRRFFEYLRAEPDFGHLAEHAEPERLAAVEVDPAAGAVA